MNVQQKLALRIIKTKLNLLSLVNPQKAGEVAFTLFCTPLMKTAERNSEIFLKGESLQFNLNGKLVKGFRCNHPQKKKVLLVHGFSSTCHNFDAYVEPLVNKGYEVLAFDAPAHGASEGSTLNADDYSDMIRKVMELYGPIKSFLAHSFGGLAVCLALENQEHDDHTKVVLIAPATETTSSIDHALLTIGMKNETLKQSLKDMILSKTGNMPAWFSIRRALKNIKASILWFHDKDDDVTPVSDAITVQKDNPVNVKFRFTTNLGHRRIYRDSTVISEAVSFL
ncbi:MAG: alpha/beta fold hydrolase [Ferruginibacter sp.]